MEAVHREKNVSICYANIANTDHPILANPHNVGSTQTYRTDMPLRLSILKLFSMNNAIYFMSWGYMKARTYLSTTGD